MKVSDYLENAKAVSVAEVPSKRILVDSLVDIHGNPMYVDVVYDAIIFPGGIAAVFHEGVLAFLAESLLRPRLFKGALADVCYYDGEIKRRAGKWLCLHDAWGHGYFHWITEQLPRLLLACKAGFGGRVIMKKGYAFMRDSLSMLGMHAEKSIYDDGKPCIVDELYIPTQYSGTQLYKYPALFELFRKRFLAGMPHTAPFRRTYIRRRPPAVRHVVNEKELIKLLSAYKIDVVHMEDIPFRKQVQIANESTLLMGALGSGMTNCIFMQNDQNIIEFFPPTYICPYHIPAIDMLHLRYHMIPSEYFPDTVYEHGNNIEIYIHILEVTLKNIYKTG